MRLFVAVELPPPVRDQIAAIQEGLRDLPLPVRWVRPEGIHLTLRFIGEVGKERLEAIREALVRLPGDGISPFRIGAAGVGTFPESGAPRVLWVGLHGDLEAIARLAQGVESALTAIGIPAEPRPFRPHLTLGRVRGRERGDWREYLRKHDRTEAGQIPVDGFCLFESQLGPGGATYRILARFGLSGETAA